MAARSSDPPARTDTAPADATPAGLPSAGVAPAGVAPAGIASAGVTSAGSESPDTGAAVSAPVDAAHGDQSDDAVDRGRRWTVAGVIGTGVGLLPHVLHHVGLLAGTALIAGLGGTLLFGLLGLAATIPLLLRLRRRFASWWAPAIAFLVFVAMFSLSAFVIGPALRHTMDGPSGGGGQPVPSMDPNMHNQHHPRK
jgi:hypothetical protein